MGIIRIKIALFMDVNYWKNNNNWKIYLLLIIKLLSSFLFYSLRLLKFLVTINANFCFYLILFYS